MNIVNSLLRRYADRALQARIDVVTSHNQRLREDVLYADHLLARQRRQYRWMRERHQRQLAERDAEIAALKCALDSRIEARRDAGVMWNSQDYYAADLERDRKDGRA